MEDTFVARNDPITSEVFCVTCGPPGGGGGGTTTGPAMLASDRTLCLALAYVNEHVFLEYAKKLKLECTYRWIIGCLLIIKVLVKGRALGPVRDVSPTPAALPTSRFRLPGKYCTNMLLCHGKLTKLKTQIVI